MSSLTIGRKLGLGVATLGAFLLVLSFTSLRAISKLGEALDESVNGTARRLELVGATRAAFQELKDQSLRDQIAYAILELEKGSASTAAVSCSSCHVPAPVDESVRTLEATERTVRKQTAELQRLLSDEISRKSLASIEAGASTWLADSRQYLALANSKKFEDAHAVLRDQMFPILDEVEKAEQILAQRERDALARSGQSAQATIRQSRWTAFLLIGLNLLVVGVVLWLVQRVTTSFRVAVAEMQAGSIQVAAAAGQVTAASQSLAQGASEQAGVARRNLRVKRRNRGGSAAQRRELAGGREPDGAIDGAVCGDQPFAHIHGPRDGRDQIAKRQDLDRHQGDRRDRLSDQHPRSQCGGGSGARRRGGNGICCGRQRSPQPGPA